MKRINPIFVKTDFLYTALFCEENIWQLIRSLSSQAHQCIEQMWVLIFTNPEQKIPLLNQLAAQKNQAVIWDYHVVLLNQIDQKLQIIDFDTRLPFVSPLEQYIQATLIEPARLPENWQTYTRIIPAKSYLQRFCSDRSHMIGQIDETEFPHWPMINTEHHQRIKLTDYLDLDQKLNDGSQIIKPQPLTTLIKYLSEECSNTTS